MIRLRRGKWFLRSADADRELRQQQPLGRDFARERGVLGRVVRSRPLPSTAIVRPPPRNAPRGSPLDPERKPARDREPRAREVLRKLRRGVASDRRGISRADHGELRQRKRVDVTLGKQHERWICDRREQRRVVRRPPRNEAATGESSQRSSRSRSAGSGARSAAIAACGSPRACSAAAVSRTSAPGRNPAPGARRAALARERASPVAAFIRHRKSLRDFVPAGFS